MKARSGPLPIDAFAFDFSSPGERLGLPYAYADGRPVDVFAVPAYAYRDESAPRRSWVFGTELALCTLAWMRRPFLHEITGDLCSTIKPQLPRDLAQFVYLLVANRAPGRTGWQYDSHEAYFSVLADALNHAVTARGDPERDCMIPAELDTLTIEEMTRRLRAALSGEQLHILVWRSSSAR